MTEDMNISCISMKYINLLRRIDELKKRNAEMFAKNIIMAVDIETIIENPEGEIAKKIIAHYRRKISQRKERGQSTQN